MACLAVVCVFSTILVLIGIRKFRVKKWGYCNNQTLLDNKVAIVTGANSGIGYKVAKELASRNAEVILACRDLNSAQRAIISIKKELNKDVKLVALEIDLGSLSSVKKFVATVRTQYPSIDLLINNAGVAYPKKQIEKTSDGFEIHFGVNHLGHFYLTKLLLDIIKDRIIIVSSSLHVNGEIDLTNVKDVTLKPKLNLYANSKLANIYFCRELAKRESEVKTYAVCPGWVYTSLFRHSIAWYHYILVAPIAFFFMRSPTQGAQTVLYCATEDGLEKQSGTLYRDCKIYNSKHKFEDNIGSMLWTESEKMIESVIVSENK